MKVLLDTQVVIWATLSSSNLSAVASKILTDEQNTIFVSAASAWEIATKVRNGKLPEAVELERNFPSDMSAAGYTLLPISVEESLRAGRFVGPHRDPFDRMLAAQALAMDIPILSTDKALDAFGIRRIW